MMWDHASMPDLRALSADLALPSGDVGPVDFFAFRRLALICASVGMVQSQLIASTAAAVLAVNGGGCYWGDDGWGVARSVNGIGVEGGLKICGVDHSSGHDP